MPHISAVLFDFGMVLSAPPNAQAWADMRTLSGLDDETLQREYWAYRDDYDRGTLSGTEYWQQIALGGGTSFSPEVIAQLKERDVAMWTDLNEPMIAWVRALHDAGVRTGILSNIGDAMAEGIRSKFDWIGRFHHAVWSHELKMRKPEPEIYAAAATGLQTPPERILFIDDREENINGARAAGMQGLVYRDHAQFVADMETHGYGYLLRISHGVLP